jgi:ribosomal protein S15P/S13E
MKIYLFLLSFTLQACSMEAQVKIDSVFIYNYFPERGFTTAGLSTELQQLKKEGVGLISLSYEDSKVIEKIINESVAKKQRQTKTGGGAFFGTCQVGSESIDLILFNNLIVDMTNHIDYWIKDEINRQKISDLILKIKENNK